MLCILDHLSDLGDFSKLRLAAEMDLKKNRSAPNYPRSSVQQPVSTNQISYRPGGGRDTPTSALFAPPSLGLGRRAVTQLDLLPPSSRHQQRQGRWNPPTRILQFEYSPPASFMLLGGFFARLSRDKPSASSATIQRRCSSFPTNTSCSICPRGSCTASTPSSS